MSAWREPLPQDLSEGLGMALGPSYVISRDIWLLMTPLERYVLGATASNRHLLLRALDEILPRHRVQFRPTGAWSGSVAHAIVHFDGRTFMDLRNFEFFEG